MQIDLIYFTKDITSVIRWTYGSVHTMPFYTDEVIPNVNELLKKNAADWLFFWDGALGSPDGALIQQLANTNIDVWHGGLKLGLAGQPSVLDYIDPAWLYNKDATGTIESSSFRLSLRACLVRKNILTKLGGLSADYWTLDAAGLALGYSIIKSGGIMRYHPQLVRNKERAHAIPLRDEWVFTHQFFPKKWQLWVLLNRKGIKVNYRYWQQTKHVKTISLKPSLHPSQLLPDVKKQHKVSVLAPTLDRYPYLKAEFEQLAEQTILPHEVLVTDQTDTADRQVIATKAYQQLDVHIFQQEEKGQCIAWNKLLKEATGEYVLFLGDDADNITPDFIEKLLSTAEMFGADMVASNVVELKAPKRSINHHYYMSDTFPITLIKRQLVLDAGMMDMFFNKNIRADYDLAIRSHQLGALMIFDSSALIDHHRAPSGGLRAHKARAITNAMSKNFISIFAEPTVSELFLVMKHFGDLQFRMFVRIKFFEQLMINGNILKKIARVILFLWKAPGMKRRYKERLHVADAELKERGLLHY